MLSLKYKEEDRQYSETVELVKARGSPSFLIAVSFPCSHRQFAQHLKYACVSLPAELYRLH